MRLTLRILSLLLVLSVTGTALGASQRKVPAYEKYIKQYSSLAIQHQKSTVSLQVSRLHKGYWSREPGEASWHANRTTTSASNVIPTGGVGVSITTMTCAENVSANIRIRNSLTKTTPVFWSTVPRYASLFKLKITDYKGWARGLQKCGYATDRAYANRLIKLIEDYDLYRYDTAKGRKKSDKQPAHISRYTVYRTNGLLYVYSNGKDSFDDIAASLGFRVKDLKKYNEVPEDFPLQKNDIVYLEKKKKKADKPNYDHVVQVGESMHSIAQKYGIQIKSLYKMNKKHKDYIPEEGDVLKLR